MASCKQCGSPHMETRALTDKDLADIGIPVRVADGAHVWACQACGREEIFVQSMSELLVATAMTLAFVPYKLNSHEIKFSRKALGFSGKRLAALLSVQPETVSRWENGKQPINDAAEKLFRMTVVSSLRDRVPSTLNQGIDVILSLDLSPVRRDKDVPVLVYGDFEDVDEGKHTTTSGEPPHQRGYRMASAR